MNAATILRSLGPIDLRSVRRDSLLKWMVLMPLFMALVLRLALPPLTASLLAQDGFDLTPYYPVIASYFLVALTPMVLGVLIGFLLLDEKDDSTLTALQVTPMPLSSYVAYRVAIPVILTIVLMFAVFPLANLTPFDPLVIGLTAIAAAPLAPLFALFLAAYAQNKVQGFALAKLVGVVLLVPVFAYFVDSGWQIVFGIVPTYWAMKVNWMLQAGEPGVWLYVVGGIVYPSLLTALLVRRFNKVMHQ